MAHIHLACHHIGDKAGAVLGEGCNFLTNDRNFLLI